MELTSADGSVVTPGSQCVSDTLTGDTFGSLQYVAVITAELDAGANSSFGDKQNNICQKRVYQQ